MASVFPVARKPTPPESVKPGSEQPGGYHQPEGSRFHRAILNIWILNIENKMGLSENGGKIYGDLWYYMVL